MYSQPEFGKYTEDDDEDYDDIFDKPSGAGVFNADIPPIPPIHGAIASQSMQTLQLNTRLSNRSWVCYGCFTFRSTLFTKIRSLEMKMTKKTPSQRYVRMMMPFKKRLSAQRTFQIDEGFAEEDLESNLQRDKYARLCNQVNQLIDELTPSAPDFQLRDACDQLVSCLLFHCTCLSDLTSGSSTSSWKRLICNLNWCPHMAC